MLNNETPKANTPDYRFSENLPYNLTRFNKNGLTGPHEQGVVDPRDFLMPSGNPERTAEVTEAMQDTRIARTMGGRAVEYALVGKGRQLKIISYGWGGSPRAAAAHNEAAALALQESPDTTLMFVGNPGIGGSDPLSRAASKEVAKTGSFIPYGEHMMDALSDVINSDKYDGLSLRGHSLGGRIAIGMAAVASAEGRKKVDSLVAFDPPGSRDLGLKGIAQNFMGKEGAHTAKYLENSLDPRSRDIQRENDAPQNVLRSLWATGRNGGLVSQFVREPRGMAHDSLQSDLQAAAPNVLRRLEIVSPSLSELNRTEDIARIVGTVAKNADSEAEIWLRELPGHTHSILTGHPGVAAWVYSSARD